MGIETYKVRTTMSTPNVFPTKPAPASFEPTIVATHEFDSGRESVDIGSETDEPNTPRVYTNGVIEETFERILRESGKMVKSKQQMYDFAGLINEFAGACAAAHLADGQVAADYREANADHREADADHRRKRGTVCPKDVRTGLFVRKSAQEGKRKQLEKHRNKIKTTSKTESNKKHTERSRELSSMARAKRLEKFCETRTKTLSAEQAKRKVKRDCRLRKNLAAKAKCATEPRSEDDAGSNAETVPVYAWKTTTVWGMQERYGPFPSWESNVGSVAIKLFI